MTTTDLDTAPADAIADTAPDEVDALVAAAAAAFPAIAATTPAERAGWLVAVADALDDAAGGLVPLAAEETHLPAAPRLGGELKRTTFQLRLFAQVLRDGAYLQATVDHADPAWPMGPRPDLRRSLQPIGPVLVFAASNFPFAFSVAGGDTAAALAAGCPVLLKAHPGHPRLSRATGAIVARALAGSGAPDGVFAVITGQDAGVQALRHPAVSAASFTGSVRGGRALFDIAAARPRPIPFYGELGSINPVVVTEAALEARGEAVLSGLVGSFTLGAGQFCTKPGLVFVPEGTDVADRLAPLVAAVPPAPMLDGRIRQGFEGRVDEVSHSAARVVAQAEGSADAPGAVLFAIDGDGFAAHAGNVGEEAFGPACVLVSYRDEAQLVRLLDLVEPSLTASLQAELSDAALVGRLAPRLAALAGRVLWNEWPTGVTVSWAQQHGGPYPATTAPTTTSVGTASIERFLRPVAWQGFPDELLPAPLREVDPWGVPRRIDGVPQAAPAR